MALSLHRMSSEDIKAVAELEKLCFTDCWSESMFADMLCGELDYVWVLKEADGTLTGYINYRFLAGEGELMRIAVHPDKRGTGAGGKLMEKMEQDACEQGIEAITLEVRAHNAPAIHLYQSFGFQAEAVRKGYYRNPVEDAVIMWQRRLPAIPT